MSLEVDLGVWLASMAILGFYAGTFTALEILSCSRLEKPVEENGGQAQFIDRLLETPIHTGLSLALGKGLSLAFAVITSLRFSSKYLSDYAPLLPVSASIIVFSLLVPLLFSRIAASKNPERFIEVSKFVVYLISFLIKPFTNVLSGILKRTFPKLLETFLRPSCFFQSSVLLFSIGAPIFHVKLVMNISEYTAYPLFPEKLPEGSRKEAQTQKIRFLFLDLKCLRKLPDS